MFAQRILRRGSDYLILIFALLNFFMFKARSSFDSLFLINSYAYRVSIIHFMIIKECSHFTSIFHGFAQSAKYDWFIIQKCIFDTMCTKCTVIIWEFMRDFFTSVTFCPWKRLERIKRLRLKRPLVYWRQGFMCANIHTMDILYCVYIQEDVWFEVGAFTTPHKACSTRRITPLLYLI